MLKQLKNYLVHDVSPDESDFLSSPGGYLRKVLLDEYRPLSTTGFSYSTYSLNSPLQRSISSSSSSRSTIASEELILNVVDDGHPSGLGNPKILFHIFRHLPASDLIKCRLVSLRWNVVSSNILQKKLGLTKIPPSKTKQFLKLFQSTFANPLGSYAIRIDDIRDKYTKMLLSFLSQPCLHLRVRLNISEFMLFAKVLQNFGNLRRLHVILFEEGSRSHSHFIWNSSYEDINVTDENGAWKNGLYSFPNITHLHFESIVPSYKIDAFYDRIVANIISASRNLRNLQFSAWDSPLGRTFVKFDICRKLGYLDTVSKYARADELVNLFYNTNLRFNKLRMEVTRQVKWELIADIILRCGDSLHELSVINENIFEKFQVSSVLRSLVKLGLGYWRGPVDFTLMSRQFPALHFISLNLSNLFEIEQYPDSWELMKSIQPCHTVNTLMLTKLESGLEGDMIEKLAVMFPNVRELFVEVKNDKAVEKIFQVYPDLTLLCVEQNHNFYIEGSNTDPTQDNLTNQSFTGIPQDEIKLTETRACGCPVLEFKEEKRSCWNIGSLSSLSTLLIRVPNTVDNITLLEGISRLDNLKTLVLLPFYNQGENPVKWCLQSIADSFPGLRMLTTSTEIVYSQDEEQYMKQKLPGLVHRKNL